jgi:hypothetical protein
MKGFVIPIIQETILNRKSRINKARVNPMFRAYFRISEGSFSVTILIKMILSIPNTISKRERTNK